MRWASYSPRCLTALWFFKLFRGVDSFAAGALAAFGFVNAVLIMGSAAMLATAFDVAGDASLAASGDQAATVQLLYVVSGHFWAVGGLFFGLWLIPMGWLVIRSGWMPRALGWVLMVGGVGYMLGVVVNYAFADAGIVARPHRHTRQHRGVLDPRLPDHLRRTPSRSLSA